MSFQLRLAKQIDVIAVEWLPYEHANGLEVSALDLTWRLRYHEIIHLTTAHHLFTEAITYRNILNL